MSKRFLVMKDAYWWCVVDTETMTVVKPPTAYNNKIHRHKDAKKMAKYLNRKGLAK